MYTFRSKIEPKLLLKFAANLYPRLRLSADCDNSTVSRGTGFYSHVPRGTAKMSLVANADSGIVTASMLVACAVGGMYGGLRLLLECRCSVGVGG